MEGSGKMVRSETQAMDHDARAQKRGPPVDSDAMQLAEELLDNPEPIAYNA